MAMKAATAWGDALVVDEVTISQRAGEKRFASVVQLLAGADGKRYVRFAYTTGGTARRGPVTFREQDVARLMAALGKHPELRAALALEGAVDAGMCDGGGEPTRPLPEGARASRRRSRPG